MPERNTGQNHIGTGPSVEGSSAYAACPGGIDRCTVRLTSPLGSVRVSPRRCAALRLRRSAHVSVVEVMRKSPCSVTERTRSSGLGLSHKLTALSPQSLASVLISTGACLGCLLKRFRGRHRIDTGRAETRHAPGHAPDVAPTTSLVVFGQITPCSIGLAPAAAWLLTVKVALALAVVDIATPESLVHEVIQTLSSSRMKPPSGPASERGASMSSPSLPARGPISTLFVRRGAEGLDIGVDLKLKPAWLINT
eukprot:CAMPEP_0119411810 /NCGR_PEP_ID=MMETSP1335-20130426/4438_1 /TAXON_ID=259385 /ORGANISM="Chrysoculter rhomboideus, Strain RCC1486" /LENGTH=251 /DNA_ID=CAMNT_0007436479 /DNA_START=117 /DNA_END=870 /DNA_ORIENTATION=-